MTKKLIIIFFIAGLGLGYLIKGKSVPSPSHSALTEKDTGENSKGKKKILYWRAPMDPTYISDRPGKSPMGMDLIPVYEGEGGEEEKGVIRIDPSVVQNIGIRTAKAKKDYLKKTIYTVGRVTYNEKKVVHIHTKVEGWIEKLYVDFLGEEVKKNAPLLSIYSPELVSTQEEYLLALKYKRSVAKTPFPLILREAETLLNSTKRRLELFDITDEQIDQIAQKGDIQKTLVLHSPTRGIVIEKTALEGMHVMPGKNLYTIADISSVWVLADIYEYELPWVRLGQKAKMELSYLPGKSYVGTVTYIYPFLESKTRTVKVRIEFENPTWELKPDMYANVTLESPSTEKTVIVPSEAVLRSGTRDIIITALGKGKFLPKEVTLGRKGDGEYEILKG
ncbi:MAG: efflux RND transporter periplasmic adaptor subunit, partial [Candidatus Dadabacteria bacterium]